MLAKKITYIDYDNVERTEVFHFNLSKAEILEMDMTTHGGIQERLIKIAESKDAPTIMKTFKEIIGKAYGIKSDDGRRLEKSDKISESFFQTEAYSVLLMELVTDADAASKFINSVIPQIDNASSIPAPAIK